ncbi:MAG TPA: hypothetical protein ENF48_09140 [Desulfobacteraceae bacterium]|nr:hypothetical protein [Deltaproteobacteria bacterium]RLB94117.1 MAG: hypothetical protein DRH76_09550 [Deltaproteobacteria bacterium]HDI60499.1 hypothetical protein [Desulfobacteraceae bacterium]
MDASFSATDQVRSAGAGGSQNGVPVPGGVYLCQVNEMVSCGACCGLYNVADASRPALEAMLARRTTRFSRLPRQMEAILAFGEQTAAVEGQPRPYPDFHHCPYLGLIGEGRTRVGCLLHPLAAGNQGVDFRGLSEYGGMACRIYFCPSTRRLPGRYKAILRICFDNWYDYGLVVTERHLVAALLAEVERCLGQPLDPGALVRRPAQAAALGALLAIKRDWPFRHPSTGHLCHDLFRDDGGQRGPAGIEAQDFHTIVFRALESHLETAERLAAARAEVDRRLAAAVRALSP